MIKKKFTVFYISFSTFLYNLLIIDTKKFLTLKTFNKDCLELILIVIVYLLGRNGIKKSPRWIIKTWDYLYICFIAFFTLMLLTNEYIYRYTINDQYRFTTVKQFIANPILFLILIFIKKLNDKKIRTHYPLP